MMKTRNMLTGVAVFGLASAVGAGLTWDEIGNGGGDAGDAPIGSFQTQEGGNYSVITGNNTLGGQGGDNGIDSYKITITDAANFFIWDEGGNDTKAFLFDLNGNAVMANDDNPSGAFGFSFGFGDANTHTGSIIGSPGVVSDGEQYILAIGGFGDEAVDAAGGSMFVDDGGDFSALTGPSGAGPMASWAAGGAGAYEVHMNGAMLGKIPAPGALALLGVGVLVAGRRRRA